MSFQTLTGRGHEFLSSKSLLMIALGLFSLVRIGNHPTQIFKEIFPRVQLKRVDAIDVDDIQNCSCEINSERRFPDSHFSFSDKKYFLEPECHCEWKNRITQEEEESFKSGRNFWTYHEDYYRNGFLDVGNLVPS